MGHVAGCVLRFSTDQLDGLHQFLGIGIIEQEWKALNGFVRQAADAGFFPRQVLVKKIDLVARARELLTTYRAGRSASVDRYLIHGRVSLSPFNSVPGR